MAQRTIVHLEDDLDGSQAAETVRFGLDGQSYEIDLNEAHATELRDALQPFIEASRSSVRSVNGRRPATRRTSPATGASNDGIRAWARANGYKVSDRGRISAKLREAFEAVR